MTSEPKVPLVGRRVFALGLVPGLPALPFWFWRPWWRAGLAASGSARARGG